MSAVIPAGFIPSIHHPAAVAQPPPMGIPHPPTPVFRRTTSPAVVIAVAVLIVFVAIAAIGLVLASFTGFDTFGIAPFCGIIIFFLVFVVIIVAAAATGGFGRGSRLPPPPQIQQPMVPAGLQGPIALSCPNCGAPPQSVDRFGVATCTYCNTRYLVR